MDLLNNYIHISLVWLSNQHIPAETHCDFLVKKNTIVRLALPQQSTISSENFDDRKTQMISDFGENGGKIVRDPENRSRLSLIAGQKMVIKFNISGRTVCYIS